MPSRRDLLSKGAAAAGALAAGVALADKPATKPPRVRWAQGWLIWRDVKGQTLRQAIEDLHAVGADGIEYSPRDGEPDKLGFTREQLLAFLGERNMAISGMYFATPSFDPARKDEIVEAARKRIALVKGFGAKNLVIGPPDTPPGQPSDKDFDRRAALDKLLPIYDEIGRIALEEGVQAGIHPHLNTLIEAPDEIDHAMARSDPKRVFLSADTGHLHLSNCDVVAVLKKHAKRLNYFHFKDGVRPAPRPDFTRALRELGHGQVDFPAVMAFLKQIRFSGWINVEQDKSTLPPREAAESSFGYVKQTLKGIYT
jgi:inosose dehydratase